MKRMKCDSCINLTESGHCLVSGGVVCADPNWKGIANGKEVRKGNLKPWKLYQPKKVKPSRRRGK